MSNSPRSNSGVCATGFASAVLLVVLLATCGWPSESHRLVDNTYVSSCEFSQVEVYGVVVGNCSISVELVIDSHVALPRVLPRPCRVDSWGLPPARAPTV